MPKSSDICSSRQMQTHQHESLIYYSLLWPKSVRSCVTEASHAHIFNVAHARTASNLRVCSRVNGTFISDWDNIVAHCPDITFSFRSAWGKCCIPSPPARSITKPGRLHYSTRKTSLGDLAEGQGNTTQLAGPGSLCIRSVYVILCHLG